MRLIEIGWESLGLEGIPQPSNTLLQEARRLIKAEIDDADPTIVFLKRNQEDLHEGVNASPSTIFALVAYNSEGHGGFDLFEIIP